ncbi:hypothetical protein BDW66DRAFT_168888 [Aspergillus desertorum]
MEQDPNPMLRLNSGPALMKGIWAAMAVASVITILRVIAKIKIRHFRANDILMIAALTLSIVSTVFLTISIRRGFGSNLRVAPLRDVQMVYQILLWASLFLQLAANIVSAVLPISICRNAEVLWDSHVVTSCGDTVAVIRFSYSTGIFWNLNLTQRIKISLVILLSLGVTDSVTANTKLPRAMVASIIKTNKLDAIPSITNLGASGGVSFFRWGYAENAIIIISSSIPCLHSLAISSVRKIQNSYPARSYALTD